MGITIEYRPIKDNPKFLPAYSARLKDGRTKKPKREKREKPPRAMTYEDSWRNHD